MGCGALSGDAAVRSHVSEILTEGEVLFRTKDDTESGIPILLVLLRQNTPEWSS